MIVCSDVLGDWVQSLEKDPEHLTSFNHQSLQTEKTNSDMQPWATTPSWLRHVAPPDARKRAGDSMGNVWGFGQLKAQTFPNKDTYGCKAQNRKAEG